MVGLHDFVQQCIERAGGMVDERAPGLMDALLPSPLDEVVGGKSLAPLALETDVLSIEPQAELATLGSPFLDALIKFASQHGTTSAGYVVPDRIKKKGMREEVEHTLIFSNGRIRYSEGEPDVFYSAIAQFNFKVEFLSDERRERLYLIPINLWSNQAVPGLVDRLPSLHVEPRRSSLISLAKYVPVADGYETALRALRQEVAQETEQHQTRVRKRFAVEFSRISDYYTQVAAEMEHRQEREKDEARQAALVQKVEAVSREREHKLHELGEKYRLRPRVQLTSARLLFQPKTFYNIQIDRGQASRTLTLAYDSVLERLEPPTCENCHRETTRIHVSTGAQLHCPDCAAMPKA